MADLGVNTIRVYEVLSSGSHDGCMEALDKWGIYVWIELGTIGFSIDLSTPDWNRAMYDDWTSQIDAFSKYGCLANSTRVQGEKANAWATDTATSLLSLLVSIPSTTASPTAECLAKTTKDMKTFLDGRNYRRIPIAYSEMDVTQYMKVTTVDYLTCSGYADSIDMFGVSLKYACGNNISQIFDQFHGSEIPIIFSGILCAYDRDIRNFTEAKTILSWKLFRRLRRSHTQDVAALHGSAIILPLGPARKHGGVRLYAEVFHHALLPNPKHLLVLDGR
ncbi:hypothetical protein PG994_004511 [Apiospora phragmitis]|uniref:1,3-beta-glucanosyltransferase n=1 Tax=Apiospora phragmitis TaxID=2905665 RepID=A0ABR1VRZ5_9PEZI